MILQWIPIFNDTNKPEDFVTILFVAPVCPYTGEINRVHCGYIVYSEIVPTYEYASWFSWEFPDFDCMSTNQVVSWMPLPPYGEQV